MRRDVLLIVGLGGTLLGPGSAHADFVLQRTAGAPAQTPPPTDAQRVEAPPRFKIAHGFGRDVPLAFVVRQIVPAGVAVRYGVGVDQAAVVTWSGDQPWNRALASAVHPLGLRVITGANAVTISR